MAFPDAVDDGIESALIVVQFTAGFIGTQFGVHVGFHIPQVIGIDQPLDLTFEIGGSFGQFKLITHETGLRNENKPVRMLFHYGNVRMNALRFHPDAESQAGLPDFIGEVLHFPLEGNFCLFLPVADAQEPAWYLATEPARINYKCLAADFFGGGQVFEQMRHLQVVKAVKPGIEGHWELPTRYLRILE